MRRHGVAAGRGRGNLGDGADPYGRDVGREADWKADLAYFDQHSGVEYLVDVAIVNVDSHTSIGRFSGLGSVERLLEAEKERRRRNPTVVEVLAEVVIY